MRPFIAQKFRRGDLQLISRLVKDLKCLISLTQKHFQERLENTNKSSPRKICICNLSSITHLASPVSYHLPPLF